jgi:hypothetical protein
VSSHSARFLTSFGMTPVFREKEGEAAIHRIIKKEKFHSNRRFSLSTNKIVCHSERSEESHEASSISIKYSLYG